MYKILTIFVHVSPYFQLSCRAAKHSVHLQTKGNITGPALPWGVLSLALAVSMLTPPVAGAVWRGLTQGSAVCSSMKALCVVGFAC